MPFLSMLFLHRPRLYETLVEGKRLVQEMRCLCALRRRKSTLVVVEQDGAIVGMRAVVDDLEGTLTRAFAAQVGNALLRDDDVYIVCTVVNVRAERNDGRDLAALCLGLRVEKW